jgi:hypothetical protein
VQELVEQGVLIRTEVGAVRRDRPSAETLHLPTHGARHPGCPH